MQSQASNFWRAAAAVVALITIFALTAQAQSKKVDPVNNKSGNAIKGYDAVAYFTEGRAAKGNPLIHTDWNGARWYFTSEANRDTFAKQPDKYAPQYGGYCAWAVSNNYTADIDPDAWRIVGGKLYLNYNKSVQQRWAEDIPGRIKQGNANWPNLHK